MINGTVLLLAKGLDFGGMERVVCDLAIGLAERDVAVAVAVINPARSQLAPQLHEAGIPLHSLGGTDRLGAATLPRLRALCRSIRPAVVHAHGPMAGAAAAAAAPGRTPVVLTVHTTWKAMHPVTRTALRWLQPRRGPVVAVSSAVRAGLPEALRRVSIEVGHGVDPARCAAAVAQVGRGGTAHRPLTALAVASHRTPKNHANLLRSVALARAAGAELTLVVVGDGPQLEAHRRLAAELGLVDVVTFRPAHREVLRDIAACDLFIIASDLEGQPLVLLEAMAMGRPVIATSVGRAPDLLTPANGRLVPTNDATGLGSALAELAADPALRAALGGAARRTAADHTLALTLDAHLALYESLVR